MACTRQNGAYKWIDTHLPRSGREKGKGSCYGKLPRIAVAQNTSVQHQKEPLRRESTFHSIHTEKGAKYSFIFIIYVLH